MQSDLPLATAAPDADFFGSLGRPFALAAEIPEGVQVHSWGKHLLVCLGQLDSTTTFRSQSLGSVLDTAKCSLVFALDVEPAEVLPQSVEWAGIDGSDLSLTHHKGNELTLGGSPLAIDGAEGPGTFLRGLDAYWQARVKAEAGKAGEIATLRGIYAACGMPFPAREPKSYGAALKKLAVGAMKGAEGLTKPMLDFIEQHDDRKTLRGWCGGARAKLVAAEAMKALRADVVEAKQIVQAELDARGTGNPIDAVDEGIDQEFKATSLAGVDPTEIVKLHANVTGVPIAGTPVYDERDPDPDAFPEDDDDVDATLLPPGEAVGQYVVGGPDDPDVILTKRAGASYGAEIEVGDARGAAEGIPVDASGSLNGSAGAEPAKCSCPGYSTTVGDVFDLGSGDAACLECGHAQSAHTISEPETGRQLCSVKGAFVVPGESISRDDYSTVIGYCDVVDCDGPVRYCKGGTVCPNGHGGAPYSDRPPKAATASQRAEYIDAAFAPYVWITEATCNLQLLRGRVFKFGPKNLIYGLNKQGKTTLVRAIRLALGQRAPEFGVHDSRAASGDLFNLRAPGETTARVDLKFSNGMKFGWTLNSNGSTTTHGQIPSATYALDGVEEAVTGNSSGMLGLLDTAGIEVVPRSYVEQVLGPHLPTLAKVVKDDTTTKLKGETPLDQLLGAYKNGLQLVLGGFKALKDAKTRRNKAYKESESVSHQNSLSMGNLESQMEALAPVLGYPAFKFAEFFTDDDRRREVMTNVSAKAASATSVDKGALARALDQRRYEVTAAQGTLTRAEARLAAIEQEGIALKQATMANQLPEKEPSARELALAGAFEAMFGFVPVMTEGRTGRMGCPCCPNETTVEAIAAKAAELKAGPVAARFNSVRNYAQIKKIHDDYAAKGNEYRAQREGVVKARKVLADAQAAVATTEAQIAAAESTVNPIAVSAESFVAAFMRYRELFQANAASAKWRDTESKFLSGPLTQAIQAFKVAATSLRDYTVERLRGLIAEHTGNDTAALDVFGRNIVVGESAPGHDNGIMLGTSKSQTSQLIGNICSMLYGVQELDPGTLYLAETGDVAWTEPHLSQTLTGWTNNRLQWFVQSTVKPEVMPEGWTLIDLSVKG